METFNYLSFDLRTIALYFTVIFTVLSAVFGIYFLLKIKPTLPERPPRGSIATGYQIFQQQFIFAVFIALGFILGAFDLSALGASETVHPIVAMLIGFVIYFPVLGLIELSAHISGLREKYHDLSFLTMRSLWPRNQEEKIIALIAVCLMNPFTEEIVYRGILVHMFGEEIGMIWVAAAIGLLISVGAHLYQGSWAIPFHLIFHGVAILLLLSPLGLFACFGLHIAGDCIPVLLMKKNMKEWAKRKKLSRSKT